MSMGPPIENFKRFGLFLKPEQTEELVKLYKASQGPLIGVSYRHCVAVEEGYRKALEQYYEKLDAWAVELGLPKPKEDPELGTCHYGVDFRTGEILGALE